MALTQSAAMAEKDAEGMSWTHGGAMRWHAAAVSSLNAATTAGVKPAH